MKQNWRTNLGGAISITGSALVIISVPAQLAGNHSDVLWWLTVIGFVLSAIGKGVTALFAADAKQVNEIASQVASNTAAIEKKVSK